MARVESRERCAGLEQLQERTEHAALVLTVTYRDALVGLRSGTDGAGWSVVGAANRQPSSGSASRVAVLLLVGLAQGPQPLPLRRVVGAALGAFGRLDVAVAQV